MRPRLLESELRSLAALGLTLTEIAIRLERPTSSITVCCKRFGIVPFKKSDYSATERDRLRRKKREDRCQLLYGCSTSVHAAINLIPCVTRAYIDSKSAAKCRNIGFEMTLPEWWHVWNESGKFGERGRGGSQYVMCRVKDVGPYKVGNVFIATSSENIKSYHSENAGHHGVTCLGLKYVARRRIGGKPVHLGTFDTEQEARTAYLNSTSSGSSSPGAVPAASTAPQSPSGAAGDNSVSPGDRLSSLPSGESEPSVMLALAPGESPSVLAMETGAESGRCPGLTDPPVAAAMGFDDGIPDFLRRAI